MVDPIELDEASIVLDPGSRLILYTDGITESINPAGEAFGMERLQEVLDEGVQDGAEETVQRILTALQQFVSDEPQFDDITLAVVHAPVATEDETDLWLEAHTRG